MNDRATAEEPPLGRIQVQTSIEGVEVMLPLALHSTLIAWLSCWMVLVFGLVMWNFPKGLVWGAVMGLAGSILVLIPTSALGLGIEHATRQIRTGQWEGVFGVNLVLFFLGSVLWSTSLPGAVVFFGLLSALNGGMWWLSRRSWSLFIGQRALSLRFQRRTCLMLPLEELDIRNLPSTLRRQIQNLEEEERVWLTNLLATHSARRGAELAAAGHNLEEPASPPIEIQGLRSAPQKTS